MKIRYVWEHNGNDTLLFAADFPGAYARGASRDEALAKLPDELRADYEPIIKIEDETTKKLVKAADKLSAYIKCVEELKAGNAEFRRAAEQTRAALDAKGAPASVDAGAD